MALLAEPRLFGAARGTGGSPSLGAMHGAGDHFDELASCIFEVALAIARCLADHQNLALRVELALGDDPQPGARIVLQHDRTLEVEPQLDLRRDLVHVLSSRA